VRPEDLEMPLEGFSDFITPLDRFFVRTHVYTPRIDLSEWRLQVDGHVGAPLTMTLEDVRRMPAVELVGVLECAGNGRLEVRPLPVGEPWGDNAVSTARWKGVLLHEVLAQAQPAADAVEVLFRGADSGAYHLASVLEDTDQGNLVFERSLAAELATDPAADIVIAYEMNGEPLRPDHGAPFRIVVPHWYAVASVKWLKQIEVLTEPFRGEFQTGHYVFEWPDRPHEPVTLMRVRARVTDPAPSSTVAAGPYAIRGKAWSGTGPITKVELSFTGDSPWEEAVVDAPAGPYQWQDWTFTWEAEVGRHSIRARATDAAGNVQPDVPVWNRLGYGNNAVEVSYVDVR